MRDLDSAAWGAAAPAEAKPVTTSADLCAFSTLDLTCLV